MRQRLLVVLLLLTGVLAITPGTACACSCAVLEPAEQVKEAAAVFTGTVVAARRAEGGDPLGPPPPVVYTFRADQLYKGQASAEFEVATNADSAACGYDFVTGSRYLVFAAEGKSGLFAVDPGVALHTSLCAGNLLVGPGADALRAGDVLPSGEALTAELVTALGRATPPPADVTATPVPGASGTGGGGPVPIWIYAGVAVAGAGLVFAGWRFSRRRGWSGLQPD